MGEARLEGWVRVPCGERELLGGSAGRGRRGPSRLGTTEQEAREQLAGVAEGPSRTGMSEDQLAAVCRPSWRPVS